MANLSEFVTRDRPPQKVLIGARMTTAKLQPAYRDRGRATLALRPAVPEAALKELAASGFDPIYGARPLKRAIQAGIENPLSRAILEGRFAARDVIWVDHKKGGFTFDKARGAVTSAA